MADITMCTGEGCPAKERCFRFRAVPNRHWQSYFQKPPWQEDTYHCEYFAEYEPQGRNP